VNVVQVHPKQQFIRLPASPCPFLDFVFSSVGCPDTGVVTRALDAGSTANKKQTTSMSCPVKRLQRPFVSGIPNYRIPRKIYSHPQLTLLPPFSVALSAWRVLEMALHQIFNGPLWPE
jgi:hypothetical protein